MLPYGIVIKQNRIIMQQSLTLWQRKFGILRSGSFLASASPLLSALAVILCVLMLTFQKELSVYSVISSIIFNTSIVGLLTYFTAMKTVREYAASTREENVQLVLTEEGLEITTEFSKELVFYNEIALCYEKNFLLTIVTDSCSFPLAVSKMHFVKGNYDVFTSLLKSRVGDRYEKRGEN